MDFQLNEHGQYRAVMALKPGAWKFHLYSAGRAIDLGTRPGDAQATLGAVHALEWHGKDLMFNAEQAGSYVFVLNLQDPDHPVLQIEPAKVEAN